MGEEGGEDDRKQKLGPHASRQSPRWARAGGWRTALYSNSLGIVMGLFFLGSWGAQLVAGTSAYNSDRLQNLLAPLTIGAVRHLCQLLEPHPPELAVGVPRGRQHGRPQHLPAAARIPGVEAGGVAAHRHGRRGLSSLALRSDPRGHLRLDVCAVARRLLPDRSAAHQGARVRGRADDVGRGQRLLLLAATTHVVCAVAGRDARRLRLRGQGQPVHHPHEAARRHRRGFGQLLGIRRSGARTEARSRSLAAAGPDPVRRRPARGLLRPAPPLDVRGGWSGSRARREGPGVPRPGRRRRRAAGPPRSRGEARQLCHGRSRGPPASQRHRHRLGRRGRQVPRDRRRHQRGAVRAAARAYRAVCEWLQLAVTGPVGASVRRVGGGRARRVRLLRQRRARTRTVGRRRTARTPRTARCEQALPGPPRRRSSGRGRR